MVNFLLISILGFFSFFNLKIKLNKIFGGFISFVALVATLGYAINLPALYFYFADISTGMALNTALLFVLIGIGLFSIDNKIEFKTKLSTRLSVFFIVIAIILIFIIINITFNNSISNQTQQIRDIESKLELIVHDIFSYDALLSENVHAALLHAKDNDLNAIKEHKEQYDQIGNKLDIILKNEALNLLDKSTRPQEVKDEIKIILKQLDNVNLELVDLETKAFEAIEKNHTNLASTFVVGGKYDSKKQEYYQLSKKWEKIESENILKHRSQRDRASQQQNNLNLYFALTIIIFILILSTLISISITKDINRLKDEVDMITKGKFEIKLSQSNIIEVQLLTDSLNRILASLKLAILRTNISKEDLGIGKITKAKEQAESRYKLLYDTSNDAIMVISPPSWKFSAGNPAAIKMFKVKDEKEFITLTPKDLSPKKQPDGELSKVKAKKMINKALKEGSNFFEWTHKRYNGEEFQTTVLLSRIEENETQFLQATVRDISEEKVKQIKQFSKAFYDEKA